jgi:hypothetical protein
MQDIYLRKGRLHPDRIRASLEVFDRVAVGDERIAEQVELNAALVPDTAREFVLGNQEANRQRRRRLVRRGLIGRQLKQVQATRLRNIVKPLVEEVLKPMVADVLRAELQTRRRLPAKRKTVSAMQLPEDQRATSAQAGPLAFALSTALLVEDPLMPFLAYRKMRSIFGTYAKKERLRRHALGPAHPDYVAQPLLWAFTGPTVEGGGARYIYTQEHRALLRSVLLTSRPVPPARRQLLALPPTATETLLQRIQRVAASLSEEERQVPWPTHTSELEPAWNEQSQATLE